MVFKIFADTNVYLDFFLQRGENASINKSIFKLAESGNLLVTTSSSSLVNVMYILKLHKLGKEDIRKIIESILGWTQVVNPDNLCFEIAIQAGFADLEDALQYYTALAQGDIDYFVTANIKDFKRSSDILPAITPQKFMQLQESIR